MAPTMRRSATRRCRPASIASSHGLPRSSAYNAAALGRRPFVATKEQLAFPPIRCAAGRACRETPGGSRRAAAAVPCETRAQKDRTGSSADYNPPRPRWNEFFMRVAAQHQMKTGAWWRTLRSPGGPEVVGLNGVHLPRNALCVDVTSRIRPSRRHSVRRSAPCRAFSV